MVTWNLVTMQRVAFALLLFFPVRYVRCVYVLLYFMEFIHDGLLVFERHLHISYNLAT
jgi:hypothetical protein